MSEKWLSLLAGTMAGGLARYALAGAVQRWAGATFPYGTLAVNLSGCFVIGVLNGLAVSRFVLGPQARLMLMIGFCGAYTTLSTLVLETSNLLKDGEGLRAFWNVAATIVLGLALVRLGEALAELL